MFQGISWQTYWTITALATAAYYAAVYWHYFSKNGSLYFRNLTAPEPANAAGAGEEGIAYACIDELRAFFEEAKKTKWTRVELVGSLRVIMSRYTHLKDPGLRASIKNILRNHSEQICRIHLNKEELDHVWLGE